MNSKSLTTAILFICFFLSINQYSYSQNMPAQGFEVKKKAAALSNKEYANKFPLHFAIKNNDKKTIQKLLKSPDLQINTFDNEDKTPWDIAYNIGNTAVSFELCKLLKDAGAVSSKEIKEFEIQKQKEKLVALKVCAGVSYKMGGYQPFVGSPVALCKLSAKSEIDYQEANSSLLVWRVSGTGGDPYSFLVDSKSILKIVNTDQTGAAIFADIEPDSYLIVFVGKTRKGHGIWAEEVVCKEKETSLFLTESNALAID